MTILVTGVNGQLGYDVYKEAESRGHYVVGIGSKDTSDVKNYFKCDITNHDELRSIMYNIQPEAVIHCAAWTNVEAAEDEENWKAVSDLNIKASMDIAKFAQDHNAKIIYISTDYVFNKDHDKPILADDVCDVWNINKYGYSKLMGEIGVLLGNKRYFIVRTSWLYGIHGKNFVKNIIKAGKTHDSVRVVNDQIGSPTYTVDLAKLLLDMIVTKKYGFYNATNSGDYISWYDFTKEIYKQVGLTTEVIPVSSDEYHTKAKRPHNSRLDRKKLYENGFYKLPIWQDGLTRFLQEYKEVGE